ncbi:MAG: hypothetical protein FD180_2650 [Planctomycetota bacterium]|nr:MAG: hypothetical protein FD180_2650 [Planctomycetota bacterium]
MGTRAPLQVGTKLRAFRMKDSARRLYKKAIREWDRSNCATAIELMDSARKIAPLGPPLEMIFAECLDHVGQYDAAERILRRLTGAANRPLGWRQLGKLLEERGCFAEALRCFQRCTRLEPDDTRNWVYKGCMLVRMGRLREGERSHRRATQCGHGDVDEAWLNVGLCLRARRKYSEAAACFSRALRIDPKYVAAKKALRDVCQAMSVVQERR